MRNCFFGRKPPPELAFLLRVLDCSDLLKLADMYGEARDGFKNPDLMRAVNKRIGEVVLRGATAPPAPPVPEPSPDSIQPHPLAPPPT